MLDAGAGGSAEELSRTSAAAVELLSGRCGSWPPEHVFADGELPGLYRGAAVFAYPCFFEGFGIPIIEAMASGTPVVASSHPSLDEASGDAAVRVDPESPEAIAAGIERALGERESLVGEASNMRGASRGGPAARPIARIPDRDLRHFHACSAWVSTPLRLRSRKPEPPAT